jgi:capsular exopolysaccharide synthesis family protein
MLPPDPKKQASVPGTSDAPEHALAPVHRTGELMMVSTPPPGLSAPPSMSTLAQAFRRCWRLAVFVALLGGALAVGVAWALVPGEYAAGVSFRISAQAPPGLSSHGDHDGTLFQKSQLALVKSDAILDKALKEPELAGLRETSVPALQKKLLADYTLGPGVLAVSLSGQRAEDVAGVLNALARVYPAEVRAADQAMLDERINTLRGRYRRFAEGLRDKRLDLAEAERKIGQEEPHIMAAKLSAAQGQLESVQRALRDKKVELAGLEIDLKAKQGRLATLPAPVVADIDIDEQVRGDEVYKALQKELASVNDDIEDISKYREPYRSIRLEEPLARRRSLDRQMAKIRASAQARVARRLRLQTEETTRLRVTDLIDHIRLLEKQCRALEGEERRWLATVEGLQGIRRKVTPEVQALRDEVQQQEREVEGIGRELVALQAAQPAQGRVTLLAEAPVPQERKLDRVLKVAGGAGVGVFALLLVGVCLLESRSRRVYAATDVTQGLGLPVLATLPALAPADALRARAAAVLPPQGGATQTPLHGLGHLTEAIDALRTVLLHAPQADGARVVMVTSATGGEGKTTLASHLAASLARAWRKTLLIDGDLRNPAAHEQFELPVEPGLAEALRGEVEFEDAIRPTLVSRLWLLPAGKADSHALQALAQEGVSAVFERLKEQFDFIVIDTSPVLPVPDALLLGKHADAVLLAVLRDVSRVPAVYAAQQRLQALGIHTLGAVVMGEKCERYGRPLPYPKAGAEA